MADQILYQEVITDISYLLDDYLKTQNRHLDPNVSETSLSAALHWQTPDWQNANREFGDLAKRGRHHWEETIPIHVASLRFLFAEPQAHHIPRRKYIITARIRRMGEGNVLTRVCPSMILSVHRGGVPISHNALQHFPECHEAAGGYPGQVPPPGGGVPGPGTPPGGTQTP